MFRQTCQKKQSLAEHFSNGEKNGKGIEYFESNILKYEGEYVNDLRNGKGKEYSFTGELIFEGKKPH